MQYTFIKLKNLKDDDSNNAITDISLDPHHTHFILVDDGSVREFGREIEFRAKLENLIRAGDNTNGDIPMVLIGKKSSIRSLIKLNLPCFYYFYFSCQWRTR